MLQCPNCKEYCITYFDTFGSNLNPSVCRKCDGLYKISTIDFLKRLFIPMLTIGITIVLSIELFPITPQYLIFIPAATAFFLADYYLYKKSSPLKKLKTDTKELGIINIDKNELISLLEKLSKTKRKYSYITILEDEEFERYLDISYDDNKYKISLSLISKGNRVLESDFITTSESLGFLVDKKEMNKVEYLEISLLENQRETVDILQSLIQRLFNKNKLDNFIVLPEGLT